jgi:hypothetical protein
MARISLLGGSFVRAQVGPVKLCSLHEQDFPQTPRRAFHHFDGIGQHRQIRRHFVKEVRGWLQRGEEDVGDISNLAETLFKSRPIQ